MMRSNTWVSQVLLVKTLRINLHFAIGHDDIVWNKPPRNLGVPVVASRHNDLLLRELVAILHEHEYRAPLLDQRFDGDDDTRRLFPDDDRQRGEHAGLQKTFRIGQ